MVLCLDPLFKVHSHPQLLGVAAAGSSQLHSSLELALGPCQSYTLSQGHLMASHWFILSPKVWLPSPQLRKTQKSHVSSRDPHSMRRHSNYSCVVSLLLCLILPSPILFKFF